MAEYKDSEEIKRQLRIWVQECEDWLEYKEANCFRDCIDLIDQIPAADVVEVVRCKDCKYWKCYGGQYADDGECWHLGELDCCMHKDDYCSKGRRKMDKEE